MSKSNKITVEQFEITVYSKDQYEYISLTDMARYRDAVRTNYIIQNWLRTRNAIEFCGLWEQLNNPDFKRIEFDAFKNEAGQTVLRLLHKNGLNRFSLMAVNNMSLKQRVFVKETFGV